MKVSYISRVYNPLVYVWVPFGLILMSLLRVTIFRNIAQEGHGTLHPTFLHLSYSYMLVGSRDIHWETLHVVYGLCLHRVGGNYELCHRSRFLRRISVQ